MKKVVWAKIPRVGLANKILVWANAYVFAKENNVPLVVTNWLTIFIGPILRGENSLRFYFGYFNNDSIFKRLNIRIKSKFLKIDKNVKGDTFPKGTDLVVFDTYMDWLEFFDRIRLHRERIKSVFFKDLLKKKYKVNYDNYESLNIGVHIRMGDFGMPNTTFDDDFNPEKNSSKRTPIRYFVDVINSLRAHAGKPVEVHVFSDGNEDDLREVLELERVQLVKGNKDIEDLLMLSKCRVIVTSATSTFSLLAAYFSEAVILHHPNFYIRPIRNTEDNNLFYEGPFKENTELKRAIQELSFN